MDQETTPSLGRQLMDAGYPKSHAYQIAGAERKGKLSLPVALRTYRRTKLKLGPIADADEAKIAELMKLTGEAA